MPTAKRKHAKVLAEVAIPDKLYFRIGEVSELAELPTYVLRFWETEFSQLKPTKGSTGQRMYRRKDVEYVIQIRKLLYEDGFTIAGAREKLREELRSNRPEGNSSPALAQTESPVTLSFPAPPAPAHKAQPTEELQSVRRQLRDVLSLLS